MARSPLAPSATTSAPPVRRRHDPDTIRRSTSTSPSPPSTPASSQGSVSAAALAASITGAGGATGVVQRWVSATPSAQRPQIGSHRSTPALANTPAPSPATQADAESSEGFGSDRSVEWFREQLDQHLDRVVRMLEDRMIVELERRGGRAWRRS
jgi:hypothetical protein